MKKAVWSGILVAVVLCWSTLAHAQTTDNKSLTVTATVNAKAKLTLGAPSIAFADADPDGTPTLSADPVTVDVKARTSAAGNVQLTVLATGDLESGGDAIPIGNLSWTVGGDAGLQAGTANSSVAQVVGSWTGSGSPSGSQTYALVNSWSYATGNYTVTLNYTLSAP